MPGHDATRTPWSDINLRDSLDDDGRIPSPNVSWWISPDIIPMQAEELSPEEQRRTWAEDAGRNVLAGVLNNIYVRGWNYKSTPQSGRVFLYWSDSALLTHPRDWKHQVLRTATGLTDYVQVSGGANDFVCSSEHFEWRPPSPMGTHPCLIARVVTEGHANPLPADEITSEEYARWVRENPGVCHRNVTVVPTTRQEHLVDTGFTNPDPVHTRYRFVIAARQLPVGTAVQACCDDPHLRQAWSVSRPEAELFTSQPVMLPPRFKGKLRVETRLPRGARVAPGASLNIKFYRVAAQGESPIIDRYGQSPAAIGFDGEPGEVDLFLGNYALRFA
ncbi:MULTISPECIES: hypothetical protein [Myxococcus]|uniref:hypothetical protein n=1 Tax=Myxococcus TaxID=32 RepID=UPI0013D2600C|nr:MULTISPECIES: hypothetical protein [Myxococcus]NVJ22004.1 hypothetical protein [Myxococcus sp. AM011]